MKKYLKETVKYLLRCRPLIAPYIREIEYMYGMSKEELQQRNEKVFLRIFRRAYNDSVFYHKLYTGAGIKIDDIKTLDDIKKLPVITKDMVRKHADEMTVVPKWRLIANHTSGTTGTPLTVYEDWPSIWREQAYFYCYRKRCGFTYGQPLVSLRGNLDRNDIYLNVHISNTLYLSSYNINADNVKTYYDKITSHKPVAIEGYPSSLYTLGLLLKDKGLKLHIPLTFTSSENLLDYQRKLIENQFDSQVYDHFGTTERTIRLSECIDHGGYYEDPGYSINEYVEDGEITTSLINESFPMIRYKGNDIMELLPQDDKRYAGFPVVKKIDGRAISYIIGKDGTRYSDAALTFIFKSTNNVRFAQFVQKEKGSIQINIVPNEAFNIDNKKEILNLIDEKIGLSNMDVKISQISQDGLIYTRRNKLALIINKINNNL